MVSINLERSARHPAPKTTSQRQRRRATVSLRRLKRERSLPIVNDDDVADLHTPASRRECRDGVRPCPFVSCRFHLYLDVNSSGSIKLNFPDLEPWELTTSCSLDVAEDGSGRSLEELGKLMNLTRERTRQIERHALDVIAGVVGIDRGKTR